MKQLNNIILYNLLVIIFFFIIYSFLSDQFVTNENKKVDTMDVLNLTFTIQSTVGNALIKPTTNAAKCLITLQQFLLIFGNLIILHHV